MASSTPSATSSWPPRMCDCGFGHCVVQISRSAKTLVVRTTFALELRSEMCVVGWLV
ncbi:hypothetical protein CsSME_00012476 [Camellia sinensis var. sinensis]